MPRTKLTLLVLFFALLSAALNGSFWNRNVKQKPVTNTNNIKNRHKSGISIEDFKTKLSETKRKFYVVNNEDKVSLVSIFNLNG